MNLHDMADEDLLEVVSRYSDTHFTFNSDFCDSLKDYFEEHDRLTDGQREALINTIQKFRMPYR